jgi:hypothetical protein
LQRNRLYTFCGGEEEEDKEEEDEDVDGGGEDGVDGVMVPPTTKSNKNGQKKMQRRKLSQVELDGSQRLKMKKRKVQAYVSQHRLVRTSLHCI